MSARNNQVRSGPTPSKSQTLFTHEPSAGNVAVGPRRAYTLQANRNERESIPVFSTTLFIFPPCISSVMMPAQLCTHVCSGSSTGTRRHDGILFLSFALILQC
ncbi:hypothetical protein VTJ04DRAFT_871 [Mycothermus thermophilus]|uniref:uncharacterized protein n=1 Tax=Humicola insolens TaxID=85995 RepID=UPI0037426325